MKKSGLVGGMGPEPTIPYYQDIIIEEIIFFSNIRREEKVWSILMQKIYYQQIY